MAGVKYDNNKDMYDDVNIHRILYNMKKWKEGELAEMITQKNKEQIKGLKKKKKSRKLEFERREIIQNTI